MPSKRKSRWKPLYHGGPVRRIPRHKHKRGLKPSETQPAGPVLIVMKNGQVLMPNRYRRFLQQTEPTNLLSPQPGAASLVKAPRLPGRDGDPAKSEPAPRETLKDEST